MRKDTAGELGIYHGSHVLLTGHTGFKGSWLSLWLERLGAHVYGYALSPHTDPNHFSLVSYQGKSVIANIEDHEALESSLQECKPAIVFHLAAQPLVRTSYLEPRETYLTNCLGTVNVYEAIRRCASVKAVVCVTTDKVYRNNAHDSVFVETDRLGGSDPYSASKACVELITESYRESFFQELDCHSAVARSGNVIAGGDWSCDRLIPDVVRSVYSQKPLQIRYPNSIRPWQHVLDPLYGYLLLGARALQGEDVSKAYNFGPEARSHLSVKELLQLAQSHWKQIDYIIENEGAPYEAATLKLDSSKAKEELGWQPRWSIEESVERCILWYKKYYAQGSISSVADIEAYMQGMV